MEYARPDVDFCDGNWYQVEMSKIGITGHLIVNGSDIEMSSSALTTFTSIDSTEPLYIGGIPSKLIVVVPPKHVHHLFFQVLLPQHTM